MCLLVLSFTTGVTGVAQVRQHGRYEKEVKYSEEGFTVIPLKKEGLAMVREIKKGKFGSKVNFWELTILDTTMTVSWSTEIEMKVGLTLVGYEYEPGSIYLLFREGESDYHNFQLVTVPFHEKRSETDKIKFEVEFKITHFTMSGNNGVFGGYVNNEPAVLLYDRSSDHPKVLPGLFVSDISLLDVRANQNQSFNVLLADKKNKDKKTLMVRTYDHEGNLLIDDVIDFDPRLYVSSAITSALERDEMIIVGTYSEGQGKPAMGFFSLVVDPFSKQDVNYTDFATLPHFLQYLPPKRAEKVISKSTKSKSQGKLPDYNINVSLYRIDEREDGFYVLGELYYRNTSGYYGNYPYASSYYTPYPAYGYYPYGVTPYSNRYYNSPGAYPYASSRQSDAHIVETTVLKFNSRGKIEKDASLKLDNMKLPQLEQVADFTVSKDSIVILYKKESQIIYEKERGDADEVAEIKQVKVELQRNESLKKEDKDEGTLRFWYGKSFYVWGYQTVRDDTREGDKTQYVFYVNKVSVD